MLYFGNASQLANVCRHTNTIWKNRGYLRKICKSKNNNSQKQINVLNTVDISSVNYDKCKTPTKMSVLILKIARAEMNVDTGSRISAVSIKLFRRMFPNYKKFPPDVQLWTATVEIFRYFWCVKVDVQKCVGTFSNGIDSHLFELVFIKL